MKLLLLAFAVCLPSLSFANSCEEKVLTDYSMNFSQNVDHHFTAAPMKMAKSMMSFEAYGKTIALPSDKEVTVYLAGSEYMGGYGVEALIVEDSTCTILKTVTVYAE